MGFNKYQEVSEATRKPGSGHSPGHEWALLLAPAGGDKRPDFFDFLWMT